MIDWRHWHNEPHLIGGLVLLGWLYAVLTSPLRERLAPPGTPWPRGQAICFYSSLVIFYLSVGSPLDQFGERFLLSAHMIQHQLIIYPAAALFLVGLPSWAVRPATGRGGLRRLLRFFTNPVVCGLIFTITYNAWHLPVLYDWALQSRPLHIAEHIMFFGAALFYWWPLLSPSTEFPPLPFAVQLLYLLAVMIAMTPLFAYLAFFGGVIYPTYEFAPRLFPNFSPGDDQLLAAAIMELGGGLVVFIVSAILFIRWHLPEERRRRLVSA